MQYFRVTTEHISEDMEANDVIELFQIIRDLMVKEAWPELAYIKIEFLAYVKEPGYD